MIDNDGPSGPEGPPGHFVSRAERSQRTRELLDAAARAASCAGRRQVLAEVAALNLDIVAALAVAMAKRYRGTPIDLDALLRHVRSAYTDHVLALETPLDRDFVVWVTPLVRAAVIEFVRLSPAAVGSRPGVPVG
jgi:hypothetical protein